LRSICSVIFGVKSVNCKSFRFMTWTDGLDLARLSRSNCCLCVSNCNKLMSFEFKLGNNEMWKEQTLRFGPSCFWILIWIRGVPSSKA
jgi:hypothetical protein